MLDWYLVLPPLLALPVVLLLRLVGCEPFTAADTEADGPPRYRDYLMAVADNPGTVRNPSVRPVRKDLIGYWRLVDASTTVAKDETGRQDGVYTQTGAVEAVPERQSDAGSEAAPGKIVPGQPGLIRTDAASSRAFEGGYVEVPWTTGLYTEDFTIEAWVEPRWGLSTTGFDHTVICAGGFHRIPYTTSAKDYRGFTLYTDRDNRWQVSLFTSGPLFSGTPTVARSGPTHVAVTATQESSGTRFVLFVDGKVVGIASKGYRLPDGAPLVIGAHVPLFETSTSDERRPFLGLIQEVALHRKALSEEEIENHVSLNLPPTKE